MDNFTTSELSDLITILDCFRNDYEQSDDVDEKLLAEKALRFHDRVHAEYLRRINS